MKNYRMSNKEACKRQDYRDKRDEVIYEKQCKENKKEKERIL